MLCLIPHGGFDPCNLVLSHTCIIRHNGRWRQRRLLNSTSDSTEQKMDICRPCFLFFFSPLTSLNQYDTVAYDYPRQCLHFSLHLATSSTEVVVAPCYIRQRLESNMCSKTDSHTRAHTVTAFHSVSLKKTHGHAHTPNKTLHLTHCVRKTKLLMSLVHDQ